MNASALPMLVASLPAEQRDARIMTLCDEAICRLQEARDVEEVVTIRNMAEAFALYTRKMRAALEAQNQCQLVVLLAEARIGAELKAAQERGEVAKRGRRPRVLVLSDSKPATFRDLGIPRQRAAEMRLLADLGEERIREAVREANESGQRLLRCALLIARSEPLVDLEGIEPDTFKLGTKAWGRTKDYAAFCRDTDPSHAAAGIRRAEVAVIRECADVIQEWLAAFVSALPGDNE